MTNETHPGAAAVEAFGRYVRAKNLAAEARLSAAALRKQAKTEPLQVDAYGLRKRAKELTAVSAVHAAEAKSCREAVLTHAGKALEQLTVRMPPEYQGWGCTKTHLYAGLLKTLESQVARVSPALPVIAEALQLLLTHRDWTEKTLTRLSGARTKAWPVPAAE
ncbi:hypothetical protein [Paracidovorax oryzae]|uniref:hypothetical protein n=1 Tax=Paracidovorax oryzae TaxID=862720 RepID=UPI0002E8FBF5|nr:hypothetical protein [Paracidovorax oryzae]